MLDIPATTIEDDNNAAIAVVATQAQEQEVVNNLDDHEGLVPPDSPSSFITAEENSPAEQGSRPPSSDDLAESALTEPHLIEAVPEGNKSENDALDPAAVPQSDTTGRSDTLHAIESPPEHKIKGLYQILQVYHENGSDGIFDKYLIPIDPLEKLINRLAPRAFRSMTHIDFNLLDDVSLNPIGVYGSQSEIARFLYDHGLETLLRPAGEIDPLIRPGLYFFVPSGTIDTSVPVTCYIIFWPEDMTWHDDAPDRTRRNRITFMRYLTQLTHQVYALVSDEHFVHLVKGDELEEDQAVDEPEEVTDDEWLQNDRIYQFEVSKSSEEKEDAQLGDGFQLRVPKQYDTKDPGITSEISTLLVSETAPAFVTAVSFDSLPRRETLRQSFNGISLTALLAKGMSLADTVDQATLDVLFDLNLLGHAMDKYRRFRQNVKGLPHWATFQAEASEMTKDVTAKVDLVHQQLHKQLTIRIAKMYPTLEAALNLSRTQDTPHHPNDDYLRDMCADHSRVSRAFIRAVKELESSLRELRGEEYVRLKSRFRDAEQSLSVHDLPDTAWVTAMEGVMSDDRLPDVIRRILSPRSVVATLMGWLPLAPARKQWNGYTPSPDTRRGENPILPDAEFLRYLENQRAIKPAYAGVTERIKAAATFCILFKVSAMATEHTPRIQEAIIQSKMDRILLAHQARLLAECTREVCSLLAASQPRSGITVHSIIKEERAGKQLAYHLQGERLSLCEAGTDLFVSSLEFTAEDLRQLEGIQAHVRTPTIHPHRMPVFIPAGYDLRHLQLIHDHSRLLYVLETPSHDLEVHLASLQLGSKPIVKELKLRDAREFHMAFEEQKRLFAIALLGRGYFKVHALVADDSYRTLHSRGDPVDLTPWYNPADGPVEVERLCFISGTEELCILEKCGRMRIFSFLIRGFRPASVNISANPMALFSTPGGSAIAIIEKAQGDRFQLRVYHHTSFGTNKDGLLVPLPETFTGATNFTITCLGGRSQALLMALIPGPKSSKIVSARFQEEHKKPTGGTLGKLKISSEVSEDFLKLPNTCCTFKGGEWIAGLFAQIPIHIAIARDNQFVPLKDGVLDSDFNHRLLGAEVGEVINSITLGWYESIFKSYMATKPVKVVSSMGEQSVGKSYSLNHLCGTSFAGSGERTTEGVWLAICPTREYLIVALDFEGVHSIERTAQEDMLLVLFNVALSNLVLFRNNFALSRNIANMFTSFQDSTQALDPAANPNLFQGHLAIVIKDVIKEDTNDVVHEFHSKFRKIVDSEQSSNFITTLHGGRFDIIPWDVIKTRKFYTLFQHLCKTLFAQRVTHATAGQFLQTLKTLMAKLKVQDWGSIDQTLIRHRVTVLRSTIANALATGFEDKHLDEQLKDMDTQSVIKHSDTKTVFFLDNDESNRQDALSTILDDWKAEAGRYSVADIRQHLDGLANARLAHVVDWLDVNLNRFPPDNPDIRSLKLDMDRLSETLLTSVQLCLAQCSTNMKMKLVVVFERVTVDNTYASPRPTYAASAVTYKGKQVVKGRASRRPVTRRRHIYALRKLIIAGSPVISEMCSVTTARSTRVQGSAGYRTTNRMTSIVAKTAGSAQCLASCVQSYARSLITSITRIKRPSTFAGHQQPEHETLHGSMDQTAWAVEGGEDASVEMHGHRFGSQDNGTAQLCSMVCKDIGRHAHLDYCRTFSDFPAPTHECHDPDTEHIDYLMSPNPNRPKDWVSHRAFWARTGFRDPYSKEEQTTFSLCDARCPDPDHEATESKAADPKYCTLPIFHAPSVRDRSMVDDGAYVSLDGHRFPCKDPISRPLYHVIFVIDKSGSMSYDDQQPLINHPMITVNRNLQRNRFGAILSGLWTFLNSRIPTNANVPRDSYSVVAFDRTAYVYVENDSSAGPHELLQPLLDITPSHGTNFDEALREASSLMEGHWTEERAPVIVFLSDGECKFTTEVVETLCRTAISRGLDHAIFLRRVIRFPKALGIPSTYGQDSTRYDRGAWPERSKANWYY
ncbi:hypothetical protein FRB99_002205 [Tulasnella sp. 403]|nr:hypothetical protein FRB99_002205 [Tulasnella sp. 403]